MNKDFNDFIPEFICNITFIKYFVMLKVPRVSLNKCIMYIKLYKTPKMLNVHFASGQSPVGTSQFES